jgi:hypothetical protein
MKCSTLNTNGSNGTNGTNGTNGHGTYEDHVDRSNAEYAAGFEAFWADLTRKQRRQLKGHGIEGAVINFSSTAEIDHDAADTPAASYKPDLVAELDRLSDELIEKFGLPAAVALDLSLFIVSMIETKSISYKAWLFGKVCGEILNAKNTKLCVAGLAFASNLASLSGISSIRKYAKQIHVSPEAVSKVKRKWQETLDLPDSPHSKDAAARAKYSEVQKSDRHWRRQKFSARAFQQIRADELAEATT